jgi:signal transduction histidine kinase
LRHRSGEETISELSWSELEPQLHLFDFEPACGPIEATILFYLRNQEANKLDYKLEDLRRYLDTFRGIRLYRDGFQIKPYGSKGNDWLDLDSRRTLSPEGVGQELGRYHVSNNQLIGTVAVSRTANPALQDRTSREGLIENPAFYDLKKFLMHGIKFLEIERQLRVSRTRTEYTGEPLRQSVEAVVSAAEKIRNAPVIPKDAPIQTSESKIPTSLETNEILQEDTNIQSSISLAPNTSEITEAFYEKTSHIVDNADIKFLLESVTDLNRSAEVQIQELQLLRALATVGIALVTFAHEIKENVTSVLDETVILRNSVQNLPTEVQKEASERLNTAIASANRVENWSNFVLERVKKSRRSEQQINFGDLITTVLRPFSNSFVYRSIVTDLQIEKNIPAFMAFPIDFEAIIINLITNSVKALEKVPIMPEGRRSVRIQAAYHQVSHELEVNFEDSGPGINLKDLPHSQKGIQQIFEPFISGKNNDGTGMGLAVVNRIVNDHRGRISVEANGNLGGARFNIKLPLKLAENIE